MKLCRFELRSEPGHIRSGMVFAGKVYETDGANAIGVHEADTIRLLAPVPSAPSLRVYRGDQQPLPQPDSADPHFFYGNPSCLAGPNQIISAPNFTTRVAVTPYIACVVITAGYRVDLDQADEMILGFTTLCLLSAPTVEEIERRTGGGFGRSTDIGGVFGPVITTPDELDDFVADEEFGKRYKLNVITRLNGVERDRGDVEDLSWTFAAAIASASQSCTIREGDILAMGPVAEGLEPCLLDPGDEFQLSIHNLGSVSLKLSDEI